MCCTVIRYIGAIRIFKCDKCAYFDVLHVWAQDLNIDLQALAASLSLLPIEAVLDLDACYCTDFATAPPDTTANVEGHANHSAVSASQNGISTQPGNHLDSTASHGKGSIIPRQQQLAKGLPASQGANNTHRAPNANVSTSSRSLQHTLANSATAEHDLSQTLAVGGAAQRGCMLQQHSDAGRSESSALQLPQQQDAGRPVPAGAQTAPPAEIEQDGHDAELDAILNAQGPDTTKPSSGVIEQPSKQEEGSLEDWLNSL